MSAHSSQPNAEDQRNNGENTPLAVPAKANFDWKMLGIVALMIVFIREMSVWLMTQIGYENLGNFLGLFILFGFATAYRRYKGEVPSRIVVANSKILKESIFAFLPICAGVGILLAHLGNDTYKIVLIMLISTLFPLRLYAYIVKKWI